MNLRQAIVALSLLVLLDVDGSQVAGQSSAAGDDSSRLRGTWRLVSVEVNGQPDPNRGQHPTGLIYYDAAGHMAVQIMPDRARPKYAGPRPTPEEASAALLGYTAYFGRYSVDERAKTVTHHLEGSVNPGAIGARAVRRYEFGPNDRLILTPLESPTARLTWERAR